MSPFDASSLDNEHVQCAVCEQVITGGKWFARIRHDRWMVALCCPLCTEAFESKPRAYVRRIETLDQASSSPGSPGSPPFNGSLP